MKQVSFTETPEIRQTHCANTYTLVHMLAWQHRQAHRQVNSEWDQLNIALYGPLAVLKGSRTPAPQRIKPMMQTQIVPSIKARPKAHELQPLVRFTMLKLSAVAGLKHESLSELTHSSSAQ